jgi:hypothetical protein
MPQLQDTSVAVLVGAVVALSVACAPRSAPGSASSEAPARCDGVAVLDVQNDLGEDIQILVLPRGTSEGPMAVAVVGRGWHTLEITEADRRRYFARTVGQSPFTSYSIGPNNPNVRLAVRCLPTG